MQPVIIKLGGSLQPHIRSIISTIKETKRPCLIVPGGGAGADVVRAQHHSNEVAHWMAILAMEQYGWHLSEYGIPVLQPDLHSLIIPADQRILLPYQYLRETDSLPDALPHSWDVTSDSISLFFAHRLSLPLILLKSIDRIRINDKEVSCITDSTLPDATITVTNDLDTFFLPYAQSLAVPVMSVNGQYPERIHAALSEKEVIGTKIMVSDSKET